MERIVLLIGLMAVTVADATVVVATRTVATFLIGWTVSLIGLMAATVVGPMLVGGLILGVAVVRMGH
jgi:hypothetical protein